MSLLPSLRKSEIAERVDRLEIPFSRHGLDAYGLEKDALIVAFSLMQPMYRRYFKVRVFGMEHVPAKGRAMLPPMEDWRG
jgi:hypothetical protein